MAVPPNEITLESKISKVTVYSDGAQVTRTATVQLPTGESVILLKDLTQIDESTLQIACLHPTTVLKNVVAYTKPRIVDVHDEVEQLKKKLSEAQFRLQDENEGLPILEQRKQWVETVVQRLRANGRTSLRTGEERQALLDFQSDQLASIQKETRALNERIAELQKEKSDIEEQLHSLGRSATSTTVEQFVELTIWSEQPQAVEETFDISYIVKSASWSATYDVRADTANKTLELSYHAYVRQTTDESWDDIYLILSTSECTVSAVEPKIMPQWVTFRYHAAMNSNHFRGEMLQQMNCMDLDMPQAPPEPSDVMSSTTAALETKASASLFKIKGKHTVKNDSENVRVPVTTLTFPVGLRYQTVPKMEQRAYLKGKCVNASEYPLMPGEAKVFLDNNFIANTFIALVPPGAEFWTWLGSDSGIDVKRTTVKDEHGQGSRGIFGGTKTTKRRYSYRMEVKNNRPAPIEIVLWDHIPKSQHESIKVNLIEPVINPESSLIQKNDDEQIEWIFRLGSQQVAEAVLTFTVEYEASTYVYGLE